MKINITSVFVDDQEKALQFYTGVLGFVKKHDIPLGEHRWLTVVAASEPNGAELLLEPDVHPAVKPFKAALVEDGIPYKSFAVADVAAEHKRLSELGVQFIQPPTDLGPVVTAVLDDTCGNFIQIATSKGMKRRTDYHARRAWREPSSQSDRQEGLRAAVAEERLAVAGKEFSGKWS